MRQDFDKKEWLRDLKQLRKDYTIEDRERWRPLLNLKRDLPDFVEDLEKEERKAEIASKKEAVALQAAVGKHRQEVMQARTMIT